MNKRTKWYIRELPNYSINVNLVTSCEFQIVESLDPNEDRGENGWGSSNKTA